MKSNRKSSATDQIPAPQSNLFPVSDGNYLEPHKTVKLAVSDDVLLTKLETEIIDTKSFQRLRRLKQLGTTYLVYPSAQHTRFEHTLGSLAVADLMMKSIESNRKSSKPERQIEPYQKRIIRLSALLHDIGNLPFGHTLEDETCVVAENQDDRARFDQVLANDPELEKLLRRDLGQEEFDLLIRILTTPKDDLASLGQDAFMYDIVKNTVCADLLDYLRRDDYFCFLNLGFPSRFLRYMYLTPYPIEKPMQKRVAIRLWKERDTKPRQDILSELIQLLENRYFLAERVYFHHTKSISSAMLARAVWSAMKIGNGKNISISEMLKMGDEELLDHIASSGEETATKLVTNLRSRILHKRPPYELTRKDFGTDMNLDHVEVLKKRYHEDADNRSRLEDELADLLGGQKGDVLIYCPNPAMNRKVAKVLVTWKGGILPLEEIDDQLIKEKLKSILDSHDNLWHLEIFVTKEIQADVKKIKLLHDWARALIEDDGSVESLESAVKEQVLQELGATSESFKSKDLDDIVTDVLTNYRDPEMQGSISRNFIRLKIQEHFRKSGGS